MKLPPGHWARGPIAVLDFETTGLDPERGDRVVEIGVIHFDDGEVSDRWGTLIHPEMELPADTTRITGIRPDEVATAPRFVDIVDDFRARLEGRLLSAYNASFDRGFLLHELARCDRKLPDGAQWVDPLVLARQLQKGQGNMKLGTVAKRLDIDLQEAHRAVSDAECAGWVLIALAAEVPADLGEALDLHEAWEAAQNAQQSAWRNRRGGGTLAAVQDGGPSDALGPGYPHGDELDPVRYMFLRGTGRL